MQVQLPIFFLCLLLHIGIFLTSEQKDRRFRLVAGIIVLLNTWSLWYGGLLLQESTSAVSRMLGLVLAKAPYYFPLFSFLVYIRNRKHITPG